MRKKVVSVVSVLTLLSMGLTSCQSPEDKAAQAQQKLAQAQKEAYAAQKVVDEKNGSAQKTETDKLVREYVENTPDLYRISWKVCGDKRLNVTLRSEINNECSETRNEPTKGYSSPAYVWGPAQEIQFINKPHFAMSLQKTGLFVKSRGCVNLGKPQKQDFYKVEEFSLDKGSNIAATNAKIELVTKQEKEDVLASAVKNAKLDIYSLNKFGVASDGLIPTGQTCLTVEEWKKAS